MNYRKRPKILKYVIVSAVIFCMALLISIFTENILLAIPFENLTKDQLTLATNMIEGAVGAIAAGFVLYQL